MNIARILNSSKFQGAAVASIPAVTTFIFAIIEKVPLQQIQPLAIAALSVMGVAWGAAIHGTAMEDASPNAPPAPGTSVSTTTTQSTAATTPVPSPVGAAAPIAAPAVLLPANPSRPAGH